MSCPRPWLAALLLACTFDASGQGEVPTTLSGSSGAAGGSSSGDGGATAPVTTGAPSGTTTSTAGVTGSGSGESTTAETTEPGVLTSTEEMTTSTSTSTSSSTSTSTTEPDTTTTGPPPCRELFFKQIELVADASVMAPMVTVMSNQGEGIVAYSGVENMGTVTFSFDIGCTDDFTIWGRVVDAESGTNGYDPDSYYVRADGGSEIGWFYGCQTEQLQSGYHWLRVRAGILGEPCDTPTDWFVNFAPGPHTIRLRNRESIDGVGNVAAVARILITNDPSYTPTAQD